MDWRRIMDSIYGSDYDRLLEQLNDDLGMSPKDLETEIRITFENTEDGRQLDVNEWDLVYEDDSWRIVADNGSQWLVTETEDAEAPFQFSLMEETNESRLDEEDMDRDGAEYAVPVQEEEDDEEDEEKDDGSMSEEEFDEKMARARAARRARDMAGEEDEDEESEEEETDDFLAGGLSDDDTDDSHFDEEQIRMGQHVEMEHTDNPAVAREIARDHLREDPLYYTKLKRMEDGECDHPEDEKAYKRLGPAGEKFWNDRMNRDKEDQESE
jgi:hypothetical protein